MPPLVPAFAPFWVDIVYRTRAGETRTAQITVRATGPGTACVAAVRKLTLTLIRAGHITSADELTIVKANTGPVFP